MKLSSSLSTLVVALGLLTEVAIARPKAPWAQQRAKGQARRALAAAQQKRNASEGC